MRSLALAGGSVVEIHYFTHPKPLNSYASKFRFEMSGVWCSRQGLRGSGDH